MINELVKDMVDAGVHYGHQTRKWNPGMRRFLMKDKSGIHIINLEETVRCLDKAADFIAELAGKKRKILFVGCKQQAQEAVREAAAREHRSVANMVEVLIRRHCDQAGIVIPEQSDLFPGNGNG